MSHKLISQTPGQFQLILEHEPDYIAALPMAPSKLEAALTNGCWLVLVFAVWSSVDIQAIPTAIEVAKESNGRFNLGIRPFHDHKELKLWMPETHLPAHSSTVILERGRKPSQELFISGDRTRNPIWLFLKDGKLNSECAGSLTKDSLRKFIKTVSNQ